MSFVIQLMALMIALLHGSDPNGAMPVARASNVALCRVLSGSHKPSKEGTLDLSVGRIRRGLSTVYANAVADLDDDGAISSYIDGTGRQQEEWIVRNVPLPVSDDGRIRPEFSVWFPFGDLTVNEGENRTVAVILTDRPLDVVAPQAQGCFPFAPQANKGPHFPE